MHKKTILRIIFALLVLSLIAPVYYVSNIITTTLVLHSIQKKANTNTPNIEYLAFTDLTSVLDRNFNGVDYTIYTSAKQTDGISSLTRNEQEHITINDINISLTNGTIRNNITNDIYTFTTPKLKITNKMQNITMSQDFYISLYDAKKQSKIEMRGDSLTFNLSENSIHSSEPVIFTTDGALLFGNTFFMHENKIILKGNVFMDSEKILASSKVLTIITNKNHAITNNQELEFQTATLQGNAKIFDKQNNTHLGADLIEIYNATRDVKLTGNVMIQRPTGTVYGDTMTYNFSKGFASIAGNKTQRVKLKIQY